MVTAPRHPASRQQGRTLHCARPRQRRQALPFSSLRTVSQNGHRLRPRHLRYHLQDVGTSICRHLRGGAKAYLSSAIGRSCSFKEADAVEKTGELAGEIARDRQGTLCEAAAFLLPAAARLPQATGRLGSGMFHQLPKSRIAVQGATRYPCPLCHLVERGPPPLLRQGGHRIPHALLHLPAARLPRYRKHLGTTFRRSHDPLL